MTDTMKHGDSLHVGQQITSANGQYRLIMQGDGNLVLYEPAGPVWDTGTWKLPPLLRPTRLDFQADGNIVLYNNFNYVGWSPNIYGKGGDRLIMQDDRNVVVYNGNQPVWDTRTTKPQTPPQSLEVKQHVSADVGFGKKITTDATLFRNGTLMVSSKCECGNISSGLWGRVLVVAIDAQARAIWMSQSLACQTACSLFDVTCPSTTTSTFTEKWPDVVGQLTTRLEIYQADHVNYDQFRKALAETIKTVKEVAPVIAALVV